MLLRDGVTWVCLFGVGLCDKFLLQPFNLHYLPSSLFSVILPILHYLHFLFSRSHSLLRYLFCPSFGPLPPPSLHLSSCYTSLLFFFSLLLSHSEYSCSSTLQSFTLAGVAAPMKSKSSKKGKKVEDESDEEYANHSPTG